MPGSTTAQPLLPHIKHRKQTWFRRKIADPWKRFNFVEALFVRRAKASPPRSIFLGQSLPAEYFDKKGRVLKSRKFYTNQNVTSKYTVLTFLPRNLLEQFRRVANVFFLAINILQFFPRFSTISPGLVILPLVIVLLITALKDGYEDIKRHQADHKTNHSIVHVLGGEGYENPNPMKSKSKTFVPAIPLPKLKSRKARKAEKAQQEASALHQAGAVASEPAPEARPTGAQGGESLSRARSQVSTWEDDPEAGDEDSELGWHRVIWEDLKVGDFVKLYENEQFPADIAILATSEEEDVAYIETKNLDGETNLKSRHGVPGMNHLTSAEACKKARLRIDLDAPEVNMFRLNGAIVNMDEDGHGGDPEIHPVTLETTCLRACVLKNTAWVVGVVMFTGTDTKVVQNSGNTPSKRSKVERQMDPQVLINLALLALVAMVCAIVDHFNELRWYRQNSYWTLYDDQPGDNPNINGLVTFANAFITFQNIVPISLYISIEFVRTAQAAFIYWDHAIRYIHNGVVTRTVARAWTLSDDLGQIEYIFSDKTGTLTQNAMIFRQCSVGGKVYIGDGQTPETLATGKNENTSSSASSGSSDEVKVVLPKEVLQPFHDAQLDVDLKDTDTEQSRILHGFFSVLGLCHTVLAAYTDSGAIEYKAQSPDEAALVQSAADVGFIFLGRDHNIMKLKTPFSDTPDEYELLHVLEFNSARKRMSVILRKMDDEGRLFLLTKGADNIIFDRLIKDASQRELREKTDKDLQEFASEGLRTLCLAYKVLDPVEYEKWAAEYHQASVSLEDREGRIEAVSERMERDLILLGATAIEDKLQDGVPETISDLKRAGIKVWVATGDKLETAVAIGYTTHLLTPESNLIIIREGNHSVKDQIKEALETFFADHQPLTRQGTRQSAYRSETAAEMHRSPPPQHPQLERVNTGVRSLVGQDNGTRPGGFSLVIEGHALAHAFEDLETNDYLLALSMRCNTVICCRVSPLQKAQIVHLIKDNLGVMCLAIGDGANDVSMIQAADVGVGISGEEGLQAVNSSDYAIAQFRYLRRLLFVHGHWSYFRNSSMILNFFYKNMIGIGVLFWYQIYCGWSTTYVFAYVYLLFWNVFWTIAPVLVIGLFDKNIDADTLMALPELYNYSRSQEYFKFKRFMWYMFEGLYQSAVVFFFLAYTYVTTSTRGDGWDVYIYEMSTTMVIAAVMAANLFSGLNINLWNNWTYFGIFIGPFLIWVFTAVYSVIPPSSFYTGVYGNDLFIFRSYAFWFGWPFVLVIALLPRYLYKFAVQNFSSSDIEKMRLVRKYHPDLDVATHPLLGGKLGAEGRTEDKNGNIAMKEMQASGAGGSSSGGGGSAASTAAEHHDAEMGRPSMAEPRPSMQSHRLGMHASARGSAVDMSTGLTREPSRGFDFTVEENGVAMARMQSRLSQASSRRRGARPSRLRTLGEGQVAPNAATANPFGFARIRERAGSVLSPFSPKKRDRANTMATSKSARSMASAGSGGNNGDTDAATVTADESSSPNSPTRSSAPAAATGRRDTATSATSAATEERLAEEEEADDANLGGHGPSAFGTGRMIAPPEPPRV